MGFKKHKLEYEPIISAEKDVPVEFANLDNKLTRRQRNFVWIAVNNPRLSLIECASKAGYKDPRQAAVNVFKNELVRKEFNFLSNEVKKKYELNYDRAVQDLYDIRDKALAAGSFNAAISAQNSLLRVGGLIVDRKEVMFGKIDQMSRKEVEQRLAQLMGNIIEIGVETKKEDPKVIEEVKEKSSSPAKTSINENVDNSNIHDEHSATRLFEDDEQNDSDNSN